MKRKKNINFSKSKNGLNELKKRLIFVVISIIIFRIGSFIPIPGINISIITKLILEQKNTIIELFNMFSGGALSRASIFALGIVPYISSSIIIQLITTLSPMLSDLKKEGESGRKKISKYTRYGTFILSLFQATGVSIGLTKIPGIQDLLIIKGILFYLISITSLVSGTMFLMWLGGQITNKGIGNGISMIIFSGILSSLPSAISNTIEKSRQGELNFLSIILIILIIFLITYFVVFIERGQRRIIVSYPQRQQGRRIYSSRNTHLPLKINMAGVIPAIFASSIILFPITLISWFGKGINCKFLLKIFTYLQPGKLLYTFLYIIIIIFFCFFYTSLVFNSRETADNLKKSGAFISGIRPGEKTANYIDKITNRLTLIGSIYISFISLVPEIIKSIVKVPFYFGGTSLLIVVVVIIDFITQVQTIMISSQYDSTLKKSKLKKF
ncbi:preprotein translocase subunit SecY [Sodalis-like secondary symbiont of Drepanosiphum platanoidis]|uniref:preprotein translocase subunit SecY n=1 Tax=Sodalis-like secondary symbiont of Drepanosiphum platanoidis TaxID=2994493 RepID=UPI003464208F